MNARSASRSLGRRLLENPRLLGLLIIVVVGLGFVVAYSKDRIVSVLTPGDKITAEFTRDYKLDRYTSLVKVAGVNIGEVANIDTAPDGGALVTMRVDRGIKDKIGGEPMAIVRPTLVVGGVYYIELIPGGRGSVFNGHIPVSRTTVPVELDQVLSPINTSAQHGMQGLFRHFDDTLAQGGSAAIRRFAEQTPPALRPTAEVLTAFRGTKPDQDLNQLVSGFEGFAAVLNRKDGQFANIIDSLNATTAALNVERQPIASTLHTLPATLITTRTGLADLQGSLDRLTDTAPKFRDSAQEFDPFLGRLGPVLHRARPVMRDLHDVLDDAQPLLRRLVPLVRRGNGVLDDIRGPVLDRLNGPIKHAVMNPWHGAGVYAGGGNNNTLYQEIAYLCVAFDQSWKFHDQNGPVLRLEAAENGDALTSGSQFPRTTEEMLQDHGKRPLGPTDSTESHRDKGLSNIDNTHPINGGMAPIPVPGNGTSSTPGKHGGNLLMLPFERGSK